MGDRGNIYVKQHPAPGAASGGIFIYSHWSGFRLPELLQDALKKGESRWDDEPYLTRIIAQGIFGDDDGITGYGITTYLTDNDYPVLVVDSERRMVGVAEAPRGTDIGTIFRELSFEAFTSLDKNALESFRDRSSPLASADTKTGGTHG